MNYRDIYLCSGSHEHLAACGGDCGKHFYVPWDHEVGR